MRPMIFTLQASLTSPPPCYLEQPHYITGDGDSNTKTRAHSGDKTQQGRVYSLQQWNKVVYIFSSHLYS